MALVGAEEREEFRGGVSQLRRRERVDGGRERKIERGGHREK